MEPNHQGLRIDRDYYYINLNPKLKKKSLLLLLQPEAVTVKFSKGENDRSLKWKEKSYSTMIKREEEEPWIDMKFNQVNRGITDKQMIFCVIKGLDFISFISNH